MALCAYCGRKFGQKPIDCQNSWHVICYERYKETSRIRKGLFRMRKTLGRKVSKADYIQQMKRKAEQKSKREYTYWQYLDAKEEQKFERRYFLDWLQLQLGNKCKWCDRTSQQIRLEFNHVNAILGMREHESPMKEYEKGEELELLCWQSHDIWHALGCGA